MEKRYIKSMNINTSLLGYGCMRFPTIDGHIDEAESEKLLDTAYNAGVNYFDTAYPYHNGESEPFVGKVLDKYPRDSYYLATKLPVWMIKSQEDAKKIFNSQLERLHKDYIDFYLFHALNTTKFHNMRDLGIIDNLVNEQKNGRIKYLGFSFHDSYESFKEIIEYRKWDFCQIQLNYMDTDEQAGMEGYKLSVEHQVPLVIMEPVKGGSLAALPDDIVKPFRELDADASTASWALRWAGSLENVKVVLSGMTSAEQVADNIATFTNFHGLDDREKTAVLNVSDALRKRVYNGCTGCRYCMPCPKGVDIPFNFRIWNTYGMYQNINGALWQWLNEIEDTAKAKNCIKCGKCETACPQKLSIRDNLETLQKQLDELKRD